MKPSYTAGMLAHLLRGHPEVRKVETFAEVGAVGFHWPPHGVKVTLADGTAVFLSTNATAAPGEDLSIQPDVFRPEDLEVQPVPSVRSAD